MNEFFAVLGLSLAAVTSNAATVKPEVKAAVDKKYQQSVVVLSSSFDADELTEELRVQFKKDGKVCQASVYVTTSAKVVETYRTCK